MFKVKWSLRMLCACMAVVCMLEIAACSSVSANAESITVSGNAEQRLQALKDIFTPGWYWNHWSDSEISQYNITQQEFTINGISTTISNKACISHTGGSYSGTGVTCNRYRGNYQCLGYARLMYNLIWGQDTTTGNKLSYSQNENFLDYAEVGDYVYFTHNSSQHGIIVTGIDTNSITFTDCNWEARCIIRWNCTWTKEKIYNYIRKSTDKEGWIRSNNAIGDPITPSGGITQPTISPARYSSEYRIIYSNGVRVRSGPGTSYTILTALGKDTHFWVDDRDIQLVSANGFTWAPCWLSDGTEGWIAISDPTLMELVGNYILEPISLMATASPMQADGTFTVTLNIVNNPGFSQMRVSYSTLGGQASIQAQSCACVGVASGATVQVGDEITINSASPVTGSGQLLTIPMKAQNTKNELTISFSCESAVFSSPVEFIINGSSVAVSPCSLDLNAAQLTAKASAMQADGTFTVTLGIKNNPGFVAMIISSDYMERGLSLTKCELAGIAAGSSMQEGPTTSIYNLLKVSGEGDILKYSFKSEDKKQVTLRFSCDECALLDESLVDVAAVSVTVQEPSARIPGDVTGDGKVNLSDVVRLLKYVSKWDVTINEANSDVTGDGKINLSDVVRLLKYVSNWDVSLV